MEVNETLFDEFPVLKTNRLTLRAISAADAAKIFEMRSTGRINQFIAREDMEYFDDSAKLVERVNLAYQNKQAIGWAGILRDNQDIIGTCGFNQIDFPNLRAEIGGELAVEYWGKKIALEAITAILDFGLNTMNLHTIEAKVAPENRSAIFLLESLGFTKEAHYKDRIYFREQFLEMAVYTLIKGNEKLDF